MPGPKLTKFRATVTVEFLAESAEEALKDLKYALGRPGGIGPKETIDWRITNTETGAFISGTKAEPKL